ncbi:MAG: chorismate synthase, partial [Clostridia bacterium]|nr:chorismate synthase [Clostridia bacterium]
MKATFGNKFRLTVFGESHGAAIGVVIDGVPSGISIDMSKIDVDMRRRSAKGKEGIATARKEEDNCEIVSGLFNGYTTGTPLTAIIR